jgi:hypothetical protein
MSVPLAETARCCGDEAIDRATNGFEVTLVLSLVALVAVTVAV